jgi:hypothetical protein
MRSAPDMPILEGRPAAHTPVAPRVLQGRFAHVPPLGRGFSFAAAPAIPILPTALNAPIPKKQIHDQNNQQDSADTDAPTIPVTRISVTATTKQKQNQNDQDD